MQGIRTHAVARCMLAAVLVVALGLAGAMTVAVPYAQAAPAKAIIASVSSGKAGQITIKVNKAKGAKGYQYYASTTKKFDKASRYDLEAGKTKKTALTMSGLKEGKTYYVKVRAYAGKKYGKWSAVKTVKVKANANPLSAELEQTKKDLKQAKADAQTSSEELETAKAQNGAYAQQVKDLQSELNQAQLDLAYANGGKDALAEQVTNLEQSLASAQADAQAAQSNLEDAQTRNAELDQQVQALESDLATAQQALADSDGQNEELTAQVTTLEENLASTRTQLETATADLAAAQEENATLSERVDALETDLASTKADLEQANEDVADLTDRVSTLEGALSDTQSQVDTLSSDLDAEKEKNAQLAEQVEGLQTDLEGLQNEIDQLSAAIGGTAFATITYEPNGGTMPEGAKTTVTKDDGAYELPAPTKEGNVFAGWYADAQFEEKVTSVSYDAGEITLYAKWAEDIYLAYVDAGKMTSTPVAWDEATESYVPAHVYELYVGLAANAPAVGDEFQGGTVALLNPESTDYPVGSITFLDPVDAMSVDLPRDKSCCSKLDYSKAYFPSEWDLDYLSERMWVMLHNTSNELDELNISGWDLGILAYDGDTFELPQTDETGFALIANDVILPKSCRFLFQGWGMRSIEGVDTWDTSHVTDMGYMFYECNKLESESLDLSSWDVSSVTDMSWMFANASIGSLNVNGWNTRNVTNMSALFSGSRVDSVDLSSWNTVKTVDMSGMFESCIIRSIDISGFNTKNVTSMLNFSDSTIESIVTGEGFVYNAQATFKPVFFGGSWKDENDNVYREGAELLEGAHTYTWVGYGY